MQQPDGAWDINQALVSHPDKCCWEENTACASTSTVNCQHKWENASISNTSTSDQAVRMHSPILSLTSELLDS